MLKIPKRVLDRMRDGLKKYTKIVQSLRERDVSEADTVTAVKDMLGDMFGYDKYVELTGEYQIRGTFCDLAVKIDNKIKYLIEVKAAGVDLNNGHLRQALDYAAKEGIEWVVLTNGIYWHLHRVKFAQPVTHEEVAGFSIFDIDLRKEDDRNKMFLLSRESVHGGAMDEYHKTSLLLNCYTIGQLLESDPVVSVIRREFRKLFPEIKVDKEEIAEILREEIIKRDITDSEKAKDAKTKVRRAAKKVAKQKPTKKPTPTPPTTEPPPVDEPGSDDL